MKGRLTPLYREMAAEGGNFYGNAILQHEAEIRALCQLHHAKGLLDYGCGRGDPWKDGLAQRLGVYGVTLYDPAFPGHDILPAQKERFDGVICSDVLEHIPEDEVDEVIRRLFGYAQKFVWASVCCRKAKKKFPDGTNLHVTVRPFDWWHERFASACRATNRVRYGTEDGVTFQLVETP